MAIINNYQSRVLGPTEIVDYSSATMEVYPPQAFHAEPFVGFKVLCRDTNAACINPNDRLRQIDANLGFIRGKGCIIRETSMRLPDGFWVITFPVPRSQMRTQLRLLTEVLGIFEQYFGIVHDGLIEINVSGRCTIQDTERSLGSVVIPQSYMSTLVLPENTPYKLGQVTRINDTFMVFRSRWTLKNSEDIAVLTQLLTSIYH